MPKKPIDHYEHPDKLPNNPTQELSGFAEDEENAPIRYPRDAALDPQLVWKGKDQQNDTDLKFKPSLSIRKNISNRKPLLRISAPTSGRNQTNLKCFLKDSMTGISTRKLSSTNTSRIGIIALSQAIRLQ